MTNQFSNDPLTTRRLAPHNARTVRLRNFQWLRSAPRLPANDEPRMLYAERLYELLDDADQRELLRRCLVAKLAARQTWLDDGYDLSNPVVRELTGEIRDLRWRAGMPDVQLSHDDRIAVLRASIQRKRDLLQVWDEAGHDIDARRWLRDALLRSEALLAERLERS